ncbi:hypothetical protein BD324DRAFT_295723 [Kockovaella imperatae]|uniref:Uncharacterized protein n=1 Tax=Kockovaella imperatae TaxID=4999 RepID=A0A1Y1ULF8_9TREE|nr:hypothetical protein BD324DRAFT_295723 [Kockovaella imperatae]ORX38881.1 hypothetical protein BD324DRAFT_295723 [Kockovaella imperatae]
MFAVLYSAGCSLYLVVPRSAECSLYLASLFLVRLGAVPSTLVWWMFAVPCSAEWCSPSSDREAARNSLLACGPRFARNSLFGQSPSLRSGLDCSPTHPRFARGSLLAHSPSLRSGIVLSPWDPPRFARNSLVACGPRFARARG